jgi:hypothetical protein
MSYLANQTRASSLIIGGVDYTSSLIEWKVSDQSAFKNGALQTTGSLELGTYAGGPLIEDYDRNNFRRGAVVTLDVTEPGGSPYRHPRGYLYVISSSYDVEGEVLSVELGCRLALMSLTEQIDDLVALSPIPLDIAQTTYQNCSAAFASKGQYVYQDNTGALQVGTFFDGDSYAGVATGEWVSFLGVTAISAKPLAGSGAIPDSIKLSYQVPSSGLNSDQKGRVDTVTTDSYYFTQYPAVIYVRISSNATEEEPNGSLGDIGLVETTQPTFSAGPAGDSCGNTPSQPNGESESCNDNYELNEEPLFVPAYRRDLATTTYGGPGAQVSTVYQQTRGPAIEANSQYYADKFAYCRSVWATECQPNANCPLDGMDEILLGYVVSTNYYGEANELVRTITDTYATTLSIAQPSDWRSGIVDGTPQNFDSNLSTENLYRAVRVDTSYYQEGKVNVQEDITYTSSASQGGGLKGNLDALNGIKTIQIRRSTTTATIDIAPDRVNSSTTATEEKTLNIPLFTGRYITPPLEAGPYIEDEQIPVPLLFDNQADIDQTVDAYVNYLERFTKGDILGIQVGESLRSDAAASWKPGQAFRYVDTSKGKIFALRMDATAWGVTSDESAFVTNGIWIGVSNGTATLPENLVGNSLPDMDGGGTTPPPATRPPSVDDETSVDSGSFSWEVDVHISFGGLIEAPGNDGVVPVNPSDLTYDINSTTICFVAGLIVGPGDLLSTGSNGTIPIDSGGSLIVVGATIIDSDLFSE